MKKQFDVYLPYVQKHWKYSKLYKGLVVHMIYPQPRKIIIKQNQ